MSRCSTVSNTTVRPAPCRSSPLLIHTDPSLTDKPEYLAQLLKDKRQLSALPNLFIHVERLLDQGTCSTPTIERSPSMRSRLEINKVRLNLFNASPQSKLSLPEPAGDKKIFQEKVFIPVQQYPEVGQVRASLTSRSLLTRSVVTDERRYVRYSLCFSPVSRCTSGDRSLKVSVL